jgi:peptidoglycan hydrolase-like protein with peptidoglycan-binding domain
MTTPTPYNGPWDSRRIEQYRNLALLEQPPVLDGVRDISQDPDLFSIWQKAHDLSGGRKAPAGSPYTSTAVAMLVANRAFLGMTESPANVNAITRRYNSLYHIGTNSFAWCDATQTLAAVDSNNEMPVLGGHGKAFAYVPAHAAWFQSIGRLHWGLAKEPGQIQFFRWAGAKQTTMCDHVGIAESINTAEKTVTFLEGNSADRDRRVVRDGKYAACYGDPNYLDPDPSAFPGRFLQLKDKMMHGADVAWVQNHLNSKLDPDIFVDGWYGKDTKADVVKFQRAAKLTADGVVGPVTWNTLVAA